METSEYHDLVIAQLIGATALNTFDKRGISDQFPLARDYRACVRVTLASVIAKFDLDSLYVIDCAFVKTPETIDVDTVICLEDAT